jgi:uncharacterized protein with von Willebrand factor type A (vWA) domain
MNYAEISTNMVAFCRLLRGEGMMLGSTEQTDALHALRLIDVADRGQFRQALRTVLAKGHAEQVTFDLCFDRFWRATANRTPAEPSTPPGADQNDGQPLRVQPRKPAVSVAEVDDSVEPSESVSTATYSPVESLIHKDFSAFSAGEMREVVAIVNMIARVLATRLGRRYESGRRRGLLDLRATMRHNLRRGGEIIELRRRRRKRRKLKLCLLIDVSQSMDLYSRMLVQFLYAFQNAYRSIESFVFSTSLHQITDVLKDHDFEAVLEAIAEQVPGWSGGTRIGSSLQAFIDDHGVSSLDRRTVVLIMSDGWDTGDVDLLGDAMRTIHNRAACVFWLNPLCGSTDYAPTCRGMVAALPYIDIFASAHNLDSLRALGRRLSSI